MKLQVKVLNSMADVRQFRDSKTGNTQNRNLLTIAGQIDGGELISAVIYLDAACTDLPKSGSSVTLDVYRYEAENALMGNVTARAFTVVK